MIPALAMNAINQLGLGPAYDGLLAAARRNGGGGGGEIPEPLTSQIYVDQGFTGTSDGSIEAPYKTIQAAIDSIPGVPTRLKRYGIVLVPGIYPENVALRPWAFLIGSNAFITRLTGTFSLPAAQWNPAGADPNETDVRGGFQSVTIAAAQTFDFNVGPHAGSAFLGSNEGKLLFTDVISNGLLTEIAFSLVNQSQHRSCQVFGGLAQQGMQVQFEESAVTSGAPMSLVDTAGIPAIFTAFGGGSNGGMTVTSTGAGSNVALHGFAVAGPLALSGAGTMYTSTPEGIPPVVTLAGGAASPVAQTDGFSVAYADPPIGSPWTVPAPKTTNEALTRCAQLLKVLNGGVGP